MRSPFGFSVLPILGGRIDAVSSSQILSAVRNALEGGQFVHILTVNPLMLLETQRDPQLREIFRRAEICAPESIGIRWAASLLGFPFPERVPGIDLLLLLCGLAEEKGWPVCLVGGQRGVAEKAKSNLTLRFPNLKISGTFHGFFGPEEEKQILDQINRGQTKIVFAALGVPRQEKWIDRRLRPLRNLAAVGVGGSFDVLSGQLKRAPLLWRKLGLEWLYRLFQEPWRWRRIIHLPVFLIKAVLGRKSGQI